MIKHPFQSVVLLLARWSPRHLALVFSLGLLVTSPAVGKPVDEKGFISLFDGKDLNNWTMGKDRSWVIEQGVITLKREFDGKEHNADYLWSREQYSDFILELEFKIPEQANSGIFLRTPDLDDPVYTGIEVQVANSFGRTEWHNKNCAGAIYDCVSPKLNPVLKPGEWNRYRITCKGPALTVELNGQQVVTMDLDQWTTPNKNPDGTKNKFPVALKNFARQGHIGLQDHGRPVWYRNIRIKLLDS